MAPTWNPAVEPGHLEFGFGVNVFIVLCPRFMRGKPAGMLEYFSPQL